MREPKQLIEECKKHLRNTEKYKHEYKKDIRKLITTLEKQLAIDGVSNQRELLPFEFIKWYSGMEETKIRNAYDRWLKEKGKCGMCDKKKEDDGHYCCEDCGGISF